MQATAIMDYRTPAPKLAELLELQIKLGASDLHIMPYSQPRLRVNGSLDPLTDYEPFSADDAKNLAYSILTDDQKKIFETEHEVDGSFSIEGLARFRVNVFDHRCGIGAAFRAIPYEPMALEDLDIPDVIVELCSRPHGLILVTGPTGSGKSTTLATLLDKINRERAVNIITIEDPVEFIHNSKRALVIQRQVYTNTKSFASGARNSFRQDPDIVLIGELRDLPTIEEALRTAETGHLTFATLHTNTASSTITRIIDVFPAAQQPQIRTQLSNVLLGVLSQQLVPTKNGKGRVMAVEAMIPNPAIKNLIREDKVHQIQSSMATGQDKHQMVVMNQSLAKLIANGTVTFEEAALRSPDPVELRSRLGLLQETQHSRIARPAQFAAERRASR